MTAASDSPSLRREIAVPTPEFRWKTRIALPVGILLAFGLLFAGSVAKSMTPATEVDALPVVERPAVNRTTAEESTVTGEVVVQAAGWIEPDPFVVYAATLTNGSVEEVLFLEGESVVKGQVLARLVGDDAHLALEAAAAEARAAEDTWNANIAAKRDAAVAAASVRETEAALELARAELEVERALLSDAKRIHQRRKELVDDGTIAPEEHDAAEATALAQDARARVVERRIDELEAKLDRMKAEATAASEHLALRSEERRRLDLSRVALKEAQLRVERLEIKAPIDGVVMRRMVEPGSIVMAMSENASMSQVAEIYDPQKLQVRVDVPLADAAKVGVGQPAQVVIEVLPDRKFSGTVTRVTNLADIQKNTIEVKVALADPAPELKPDMLARVRFLSMANPASESQVATGLSVFAPAEAITNSEAWVVARYDGDEGVAIKRAVATVGPESEGWIEIESGLQPGDLLITSPVENLQPEQRVRIRPEGGD